MGQKVLGDEKIEVNGKQVTTSKIKNIYFFNMALEGLFVLQIRKERKIILSILLITPHEFFQLAGWIK